MLESQRWVERGSGLASASWTFRDSVITVSEGSGAPPGTSVSLAGAADDGAYGFPLTEFPETEWRSVNLTLTTGRSVLSSTHTRGTPLLPIRLEDAFEVASVDHAIDEVALRDAARLALRRV